MAQIQEQKIFLGGMDKDNSPETVNMYDYRDAHNIRNLGKEGSDENYLVNLEGTLAIPHSLPIGTNKAVGTARFETVGKAYTVIYNSKGYHRIEEFDGATNKISIVFENKTDSAGVDILPINPNSYFTDIRLLHEIFLILNNGINPIYCFNIDEIKKSRGSRVLVEDDFLLISKPSLTPPKFEYLSDSSRTSNSLRGELFQFRHQLEYADFKTSVWSPISKRVVPINEPANGQGQNVSLLNTLKVTLDIGDNRVKKINIGVRAGLNNWLLVKVKNREDILKLTNTDITLGTNTESYNPSTNEYSFLFYNDGMYTVIDQVEVESLFDNIPHQAETVEVINGNLLAVGGLTEGYDTPELNGELSLTISEYAPNISSTVSDGTDFDVVRGTTIASYNTFSFYGEHKEGDTIYLKQKLRNSVVWQISSYVITAPDELNTLNNVLQYNVVPYFDSVFIPNSSNVRMDGLNTILFFDAYSRYEIEVYIIRKDIGSLSTQSINILKTNSSYQLALAYYDKFGRPFPIVTDDRFIVKTKSYSEAQGNLSQINWSLPLQAPKGASSYQWLLSENQTHVKSIYLTGTYSSTESDVNYLTFNLKSLQRFYDNEKYSQVNYNFTKGDKVTFVSLNSGTNSDVEKWFRYPFIDLDIVDFIIKEDETSTGVFNYLLKVRATDLLKTGGSFTALEGKEILMELYTPKGRGSNLETILFYEIGEKFNIVNDQHETTSGSIREGDWYFKGRLYESTITINTPITYLVEDPNFSDNYVSNYYSFGRARTLFDNEGRVVKQASIRYSDEYIYGSRYNGISRFYGERIYGELGGESTSKYGAIKKLEMRNNTLMCLQEFKVGMIPIYRSIISDNNDSSLVADSGKIFGSIRYVSGNYGCGSAKESIAVSRDGIIYMIDDNNYLPLRVLNSEVQIIDNNLKSEFIGYVKKAKENKQKIIGVFDDNFKEYNVTISDNSNTLISIQFTEGNTEYKNNFNVSPTDISIVSSTNCTATYNSSTGIVEFSPNTDFVGEASFTWQYTYNGVVYVQTEFVEVQEGNAIPFEFIFNPKTNQQLSTLVESDSIIVSGINMPSPITVIGGEYKVNDGVWLSTPSTVYNNDEVKVRLLSSSLKETETSMSLTIGGDLDGTSAVFTVTTIPDSVTPSEYFNVSFEVTEPPVQSGSYNVYGVKVTLSHTLSVDYTCALFLQYSSYGGQTSSSVQNITVTSGTTFTETSFFVLDADPSSSNPTGYLTYSSLYAGDIVTTVDSVSRVVSSPNIYKIF